MKLTNPDLEYARLKAERLADIGCLMSKGMKESI
jgi:hypothetical protein